jgi:hypothetical protein
MKKYVIQDVEDKMYYADDNQWTEDINNALHFATEEEAFDVAFTLKDDHDYILTVITIIY